MESLPFPETLDLSLLGLPVRGQVHLQRTSGDSLAIALDLLKKHHDYEGPALVRNTRGIPVWPAGFRGSISHKKMNDRTIWAAMIVTQSPEVLSVGVDIEKKLGADLIEKLTRSRPEWASRVQASSSSTKLAEDRVWTAFFTMFEVAVKAVGNAGWSLPGVPDTFSIRTFTAGKNPDAVHYTLNIQGKGEVIRGSVLFAQDWALNCGVLGSTVSN